MALRHRDTSEDETARIARLRQRYVQALATLDQTLASSRERRLDREASHKAQRPSGVAGDGTGLAQIKRAAATGGGANAGSQAWLSDANLSAILAAAPDPIITIDAFGIIQSASDSVERVFGWAPAELIGKSVIVLMPEPHRSLPHGYLANLRLTGDADLIGRTHELDAARKTGEVFPVSFAVSRAHQPGGGLPVFVVMIRDITEQRRLARELRLIQELAISIANAPDLPGAFAETLRQICLATAWDYGEVWVPAPDNPGQLVAVSNWARPHSGLDAFAATLGKTRLPIGTGLPGTSWAVRRPVWIDDLEPNLDPGFCRAHEARKVGMRAGAAVPILRDEAPVAVLLFFVRRTRAEDAHLLDLVTSAVAPLGVLVQRKGAEEALRETEQRLRWGLQVAKAGAWYWDLVADHAWWSAEMYELWGVEPRERMRLDNSVALIHEADRARVGAIVAESIQERIEYRCEFRIRHPTHGLRWMSSHGRLVCDADGVPVRMLGFTVDVTDRRRTEDALRQSEEQTRAAFDLSAVGQCQCDAQSRKFLRVNAKLCEITGYSEAELLGMTFLDLTHPEDRETNQRTFEATARATGRGSFAMEKRYIRKDGAVIWVRVTVAFFDDPSENVRRTIAMIEDVTGRKMMERTLLDHSSDLERLIAERTDELRHSHDQLRMADRMASIGTLAAGLGHDMNNVLLPVRAHLNALWAQSEAGSLPASARGHVEAVRKSAAYLQQLADGLHFLTDDPEKEDVSPEFTDLAAWWSHAGTLISNASPKHVRVTSSFPPDLPGVSMGPSGLTQAVLNLVINAGEAIPAGRKRVQGNVRVAARAEGRRVRLSVTDNGSGMSERVKQRAFEMFFTTKPRGLGTGLGLALVRKVALRAGGSVEIESQVGKGTTVSLLLPAATEERASNEHTAGVTRVVVSVEDARPAALLGELLGAAGVVPKVGSDPGDADVWIVEPRRERLGLARAWLARRPAGRLVLFGAPEGRSAGAWKALTHIAIPEPDHFERLRAALGRALARR